VRRRGGKNCVSQDLWFHVEISAVVMDGNEDIPDRTNDAMQSIIGGRHMINSPAVDGWIDAEQPRSLTRSNRRSCTIISISSVDKHSSRNSYRKKNIRRIM
jgi:hypothetical protein